MERRQHRDLNGSGTERDDPLPAGFLAAGWADGNAGENQVSEALSDLGIEVAFNEASPSTDCLQQYAIGPYAVDFAWPILRIALEADGSAYGFEGRHGGDEQVADLDPIVDSNASSTVYAFLTQEAQR